MTNGAALPKAGAWVRAAVLVLVTGPTAASYVMPGRGLWCLGAMAAAVGAGVGIRLNRPSHVWPWLFLVLALVPGAAQPVPTTAWRDTAVMGRLVESTSQLVDIFGLLEFLAASYGLLLMTRLRVGRARTGEVLEVLIIAGGLALMAWSLVVPPEGAEHSVSTRIAITAVVSAAPSAVITSLALRLCGTGAVHFRAARLLVAGSMGLLVADVYYAIALVSPGINPSAYGSIGYAVFFASWALATLDPSMTSLARPGCSEPLHLNAWLSVVAVASAMGPVSLIVQAQRHDLQYMTVAVIFLTLILLLVIVRFTLAMHDRRKLAEELQVKENEAHFKSLVANAADVIMVIEPDFRVRYASPSATSLFRGDPTGLRLDAVVGQTQADHLRAAMVRLHTSDACHTADTSIEVVATSGDSGSDWPMHLRFTTEQRDESEHEARCDDLSSDPSVTGYVLTLRDVTAQRKLERELRHLAFHDPLTGLANRRLLNLRLDEALAAAGPESVIGVVVLDMDDFKAVNDRHGHATGDELIVAIASQLTTVVREGDLVSRLGGDEFAVVIGPAESVEELESGARRIAGIFALPFALSSTSITCSASLGLATTEDIPPGAERPTFDAAGLLHRADIAHYAIKHAGKSGVLRYAPSTQVEPSPSELN